MLAIATMVSSRISESWAESARMVVKRPIVTGVHRLEHIEGFFAPHFPDDDAVGRMRRLFAPGRAARPQSCLLCSAAGFKPNNVVLLNGSSAASSMVMMRCHLE